MNGFQRFLQQKAEIWRGMSTPRRIAFATVAICMLVALGAVGLYATQVEYRILYSGLAVEEAGAVTAKLQAQNVPFKLAGGGSAILVPADQVAQLRVSLANDGVALRGGKGFEIFDESSLGMTPFVQNVNYLRALQSELARSIGQMETVASARVHIVRPEQSVFIREQKPTTASVILKLKTGASLNRSTAQAITALVSHAVEGLTPEQVTLVDANSGRLLSDMRGRDADGVPGTQLEYRRELEQYLSTQVEELLGKSLGYGRAIIKVAADVNFKRVKEKRETFSPDERVAISERITNSNSSQGKGTGTGAGAASNTGLGSLTSPSGGTSKEESLQTDYLVSKTVQEMEDKLGRVERLTVAAMIDLSGSPEETVNISLEEVRDVIKQAVGFKEGRDEIKVSNVKLPSPLRLPEEPDEEAAQMRRWQGYVLMGRNVAIALSSILGLMLGFLLLRRLRSTASTPATAGTGETLPVRADNSADAALDELVLAARRDPGMVARLVAGMMTS